MPSKPFRAELPTAARILTALCLLFTGALSSPQAASAGQVVDTAAAPMRIDAWEYTGSAMTAERANHTLSVLPDGSALAVGGYYYEGGEHYLNSSEIYHPLTNNWAEAASMVTPRRNHTATVLLDGRVLVVGGENAAGAVASAEIYNPALDTWSAAGAISSARANHTATRLQDGRVLVAGGCSDLGCLASAEIYDPSGGTWSSAGSLEGARERHTATLLQDGSVLVAGGIRSFGTVTQVRTYSSASRYYPDTNSWATVGSMDAASNGRCSHNAVLRRDGKVMVVGGYYYYNFLGDTYSGYLASTEVFDPESNAWMDLDRPISYGRQSMAGVLDAEGNYILLGGDNGTPAWDVEYMDINNPSDTWHAPTGLEGYLNSARKNAAAVILPGGVVLAAGGSSDTSAGLNTAETNRFSTGAAESYDIPGNAVVNGLFLSSSTLLLNGDILITGGSDTYRDTNTPCSNKVYIWERASETITDVPPESNMKRSRCGHTTTLLPDGRVVALGGRVSTLSSSAGPGEIYSAGSWSYLPDGPELEALETALLPDGKIFIMQEGGGQPYIFDPQDLSFRETVGDPAGNYGSFTLTLMKNGKVLIVGSMISSTAEVFDPVTETFATIAPTPVNKNAHTATLLPDGKVMIAGGRISNGTRQSSVHVYDPAADTWTAVGALATARMNHSAILLPDGRPVVLGGQANTSAVTTSVEIYDPLHKTWSPAGNMLNERFLHQTVLALNGKLVSIGGADITSDPYDTTEMFIFENISTGPQIWQPGVTGVECAGCSGDKQVEVTGSGFTNTWEGSSGATAQSAGNQPLVQLMRLDNQQIEWLQPGEASSDTRFLSAPISGYPDGAVMVMVYVNGSFQARVGYLSGEPIKKKIYIPVVLK